MGGGGGEGGVTFEIPLIIDKEVQEVSSGVTMHLRHIGPQTFSKPISANFGTLYFSPKYA